MQDSTKHAKWMQESLLPFLDALDSGAVTEPRVEVTTSLQTATDLEMTMPDFWPVAVYEAHFNTDVHKDQCVTLKFALEWMKGIMLPPIAPPYPFGVVHIKNRCSTIAQLQRFLESSENEFQPGQTDAALRAASARVLANIQPTMTFPKGSEPPPRAPLPAQDCSQVAASGAAEAVRSQTAASAKPKAKGRGQKRGRELIREPSYWVALNLIPN